MDEKKYGGIIRNYRRFFVFVFSYLIILVALGVARVLFQRYFLNPGYQWEHSDPFFLQKTKLVGTFENFLKQTVQDQAIQIFILQGPLSTENNFILSQDNLITYKGFIVPKYFSIATTLPIKPISYFDSSSYDTGELMQMIDNIVLTRKIASSQLMKNIQLPLQGTLVNTFNLKCLSQTQIYPGTCAYYTKNLLSSFFVYDLSTDYSGLQDILSHLPSGTANRNLFCQNMEKYVLYSNDQSDLLKPIFEQCGEGFNTFFKRMALFIDIQNQLNDKLINADTYSDETLNIYKLLSAQQMIYNDIFEQRMSINEYTLYLDFVQALLQKGLLSGVYIDETYRFNTHYFKPTLQALRYTSTAINSDQANQLSLIIKNIDTLNFGDPAFGLTGLDDLLINRSLLVSTTVQTQGGSGLSLQETINQNLKGITFLDISSSATTNNQIMISGYFLINQERIPTTLMLLFQNNLFMVHSILLPTYPSLADTLQALLTKQALSIGELFATFSKDLPLYEASKTITQDAQALCSGISDLQTSLGIQITTCAIDHVSIQKDFNTRTISYDFLLDNGIITSITISDATVQTYIQNLFQQNQYTNLSIVDAIKTIVDATPDAFTTTHQGTINTLSVLQDFQKYLDISPNDIAEKSGKILIDFTISNVNFIAGYDVTSHTLAPRYFKDILVDGLPLIIQNMMLPLDDNHLDIIALVIKDPLSYIETVDLNARRNYVSQKK